MRENGPAHGLRGGGLPEYRRVLDAAHATMMILGDTCTRACAFCNVATGHARGGSTRTSRTASAEAVAKLGLDHVVITSVDRDDLADGGAGHFAR